MRKTNLLILLCLPLLLCCSCAQSPSPLGRAQLDLAQRQFDDRQFTMAIQTINSFLEREPFSTAGPDAHYRRALCYGRLTPRTTARATQAESDFRQARRTKDRDLRTLVNIALGHLYFEPPLADPARAIEQFTAALLSLDPNSPPADHILYRLATAQQMLGQWSQADRYFSRCFNTFPASNWTANARHRFGARTWRIQLGSFDNLRRAQARIDQLRRDGWRADWAPLLNNSNIRYVVHTGHFATYAQAQPVLARLIRLQDDAWIIPTPVGWALAHHRSVGHTLPANTTGE